MCAFISEPVQGRAADAALGVGREPASPTRIPAVWKLVSQLLPISFGPALRSTGSGQFSRFEQRTNTHELRKLILWLKCALTCCRETRLRLGEESGSDPIPATSAPHSATV